MASKVSIVSKPRITRAVVCRRMIAEDLEEDETAGLPAPGRIQAQVPRKIMH